MLDAFRDPIYGLDNPISAKRDLQNQVHQPMGALVQIGDQRERAAVPMEPKQRESNAFQGGYCDTNYNFDLQDQVFRNTTRDRHGIISVERDLQDPDRHAYIVAERDLQDKDLRDP